LSKQTGATEVTLDHPLDTLMQTARFLGLEMTLPHSIEQFWQAAILAWDRQVRKAPL
jgi:hypothetical protein